MKTASGIFLSLRKGFDTFLTARVLFYYKLRELYMIVACPICRTEVEWEGNPHRPFCSERCRMIDLGAWIAGEYAVPAETPPSDEETGEP
jgi:uncharacterized protein